MRPVSLTLEGFSCFKQQQTVSFDGLELFAIWGATGSGKTSLLDAIVFALFGKVPRLDERRNRDIISLTREKAVVLLDFSIGRRTYRVVRTARRKGAPEAKLEDEDGNSLAVGVREVDAALDRHLGLSYTAFLQSVMLPQGQFARFLKSEPRERREILRDLLRLGVYDDMRQRADQRRRALDTRLSILNELLAPLADATPERLAALEASLVEAQQRETEAHQKFSALDTRFHTLESLRTKAKELDEKRQHLKKLAQGEAGIATMQAQLDAAGRAAEVMPAIARAEEAEARLRDEENAARVASETVTTQEDMQREAARAASEAKERAEEIPSLRERIQALDGLRGVIDARTTALNRLQTAQTEHKDAEKRVRDGRREIDSLDKEHKELSPQIHAAEKAVRDCGYDQDLDGLVQQIAHEAAQLAEHRVQLGMAHQEMERTARRAAESEAVVAANVPAVQQAGKACAAAEAARKDAEGAYQAAHQQHAAALLRRELRGGEPCPVCAQRVATLPEPIAVPAVDTLERQCEQAKHAEAAARETDKNAATYHAKLESTAKAAGSAAKDAKEAFELATEAVAAEEHKLAAVVGVRCDTETGVTLEARVLAAVRRLTRVRDEYSRSNDALRDLEHKRELLQTSIDGKKEQVHQFEEALEKLTRAISEMTAEVDDLTAKIATVTTHLDPLAERKDLAKQVEQLDSAFQRARDDLGRADADLKAAKAVAADAATKVTKLRKEATGLRRAVEIAARQARFASCDAAKAAVMTQEDVTRLRQAVEQYRTDRHATTERITELERELGGKEVTEQDVSDARATRDGAQHEHSDAVRAVATRETEIGQMKERVATRAKHSREYEELKAEHDVYRELAEELKTDRFQDFVLEESFRDLTGGASQRLGDLTGRYALKFEGGNILVVDHDNADETRSADTLSGGETFLASLALALQLSEQIQQASGAALLESLFIDEGFGTLDIEALDGAASAIESLQGGGRMVGIITHIRGLADRLPYRIEVDWRSEGSRVEVHAS